MGNTPEVKLALVGVSRDCFPVELTQKRLAKLADACKVIGIEPYVCNKIVENESDAMMALTMCKDARANALVIYLGNFGPEGPISILAKEFEKTVGPVMLCGAAEESGDNLINGRGDALCGMLSAKFNTDTRRVRVHLPEKPVNLPGPLAQEIAHFENIARVVLGLRSLKVISFGPRPHDFLACNAPVDQLIGFGIEMMENSELDLLQLFEAVKEDDDDVATIALQMAVELGAGNNYPGLLVRLARLEIALLRFAEAQKGAKQFVIFANKCWPAFQTTFGMCPCYVNSRLAAKGIPVACEVDIYGAISEYICQLAGGSVATLLDINNTVPQNLVETAPVDDLFMGFHCGNVSSSCMKECGMCHQLIMHRLLEPESEPNITRGTLEGQIKPGPMTMFRFQPRRDGSFKAYLAHGDVLDVDPKSFGAIGVMEIGGFGRFYRHVLLERGFPHHAAFTFQHVGATIFDVMMLLGIYDIDTPMVGSFYLGENPFGFEKVEPIEIPEAKVIVGRTAPVEELSGPAFGEFGTFHDMLHPDGTNLGKSPVHFFPDLLVFNVRQAGFLGFSTCLVEPRPKVVDVTEFHKATGEGILPLDHDVLIHVAKPLHEGVVPWDEVRIFRVPQGTCVLLNEGVYHHAPILANDADGSAATLIVLPVQTYEKDCKDFALPEDQQTHVV